MYAMSRTLAVKQDDFKKEKKNEQKKYCRWQPSRKTIVP
jgi:hypothetical protein